MGDTQHHVIIGTGPAGDAAANQVRQCDPDARITQITAGKLPFIRRYDLHRVFEGVSDWRELLVHPPEYYRDMKIGLRRNTQVVSVDPATRRIGLQHRETIVYDKLLIASGGGGYLPEQLRAYRHLVQHFGSFEDAIHLRRTLPADARVLLLGGDMMGIDLARKLVQVGYLVTLIAGEQLFWPHRVEAERRPALVRAIEAMGVEVHTDRRVVHIESGSGGMHPRRVVCEDGTSHTGDVVLAFFGLGPSLGYLAAAGLDIQRGLMVNTQLATANESIWGAGDVCQIWLEEQKRYRFSYEWKNVQEMGRVAARNMCGAHDEFTAEREDFLRLDEQGEMQSSFWDYD